MLTLLAPLAALAALEDHRAQAFAGCQPSWETTFGGLPGVDGPVNALALFDDGRGPALYVGGVFTVAGAVPVRNLARWDGEAWSPLGHGVEGAVRALAVFDDGHGAALYVGGSFALAGGAAANSVARWDGAHWSALGSGITGGGFLGGVEALAVFDDGRGPALYAGGVFTQAGGAPASSIARWDGTGWEALGSGVSGEVRALASVSGLGSSPALYVGGNLTSAGGVVVNHLARWDGTSWSALGSGLDREVHSLAAFDDGNGGGTALYAGGQFTTAGGATARRIARWDGASWSPLASGVLTGAVPRVDALVPFDDGNGPALYAAGSFTSVGGVAAQHLARWNGTSWSAFGGGADDAVGALAVFDDGRGGGPALHAGGRFSTAGGQAASHVARWSGASPSSLGRGTSSGVFALTTFDDGGGRALYAGGSFTTFGVLDANRVVRWDGSEASTLGSGVNGTVYALQAYDDGGGPALFAGGSFTSAGGAPASSIARWDGVSWSPLGAGIQGVVRALAVFDDGSGAELYAGGEFHMAGGAPMEGIAKWNGTHWTEIGDLGGVWALAVFDAGAGPELYAGGRFLGAGSSQANFLARWSGAGWTSVGGGFADPSTEILALTVFDDGRGAGPGLYASGFFTRAGGVDANRIARWDGLGWSPLGDGLGGFRVHALAVLDDGSGPALFAGGDFPSAGGAPANRVARWDGVGWSHLGHGTNGTVHALATFDTAGGPGPALYVGGAFSRATDSGDSYLARWQGCLDTTAPALHVPARVVVRDRWPGVGEVVDFVVSAEDALDPHPRVVCTPASGSHFPPGTTLVLCTATDASGNEAHGEFEVEVRGKLP